MGQNTIAHGNATIKLLRKGSIETTLFTLKTLSTILSVSWLVLRIVWVWVLLAITFVVIIGFLFGSNDED